MTPAEWKRKAVHAGMGLFALALRCLDWKAAAAVRGRRRSLFNVFVDAEDRPRRSTATPCRAATPGSSRTRRWSCC